MKWGNRKTTYGLLPVLPVVNCVALSESVFPLWVHISRQDNVACLSLQENSYEHRKTEHTWNVQKITKWYEHNDNGVNDNNDEKVSWHSSSKALTTTLWVIMSSLQMRKLWDIIIINYVIIKHVKKKSWRPLSFLGFGRVRELGRQRWHFVGQKATFPLKSNSDGAGNICAMLDSCGILFLKHPHWGMIDIQNTIYI